MGQSASFPFEIGADPDRGYASRHRNAYWQLYGGKRKVREGKERKGLATGLMYDVRSGVR